MESEYKSIRRSIAQFRSIDLILTCVDIGMLAFSLKETVGCVPAGLSEMHRLVGRVRAMRSAADIRRQRPTRNTATGSPSLRFFPQPARGSLLSKSPKLIETKRGFGRVFAPAKRISTFYKFHCHPARRRLPCNSTETAARYPEPTTARARRHGFMARSLALALDT
jgi:hypothetical protein